MLANIETEFLFAIRGEQHTSLFNESGRVTADVGLSIYQNNNITGLIKVLENVFPVCVKLVGDEFFAAMARVYVKQTPSNSSALLNYGENFPSFIGQFEPAGSLPYLVDVARFEWAWHQNYYSAQSPQFDYEKLDAVEEAQKEHVCFSLAEGACLISSAYPIHDIWKVNQPDYPGEAIVDLDVGGVKLIIWRSGYELRADVLTIEEWQLLKAIQEGQSMVDITDSLDSLGVVELLAEVFAKMWIVDFSIKDAF